MVTRKVDWAIAPPPGNYTAIVDLGRDADSVPVVFAELPTGRTSGHSMVYSDPSVLRDIAADLLAGAQYLEDEREKAGL